MARKHLNFIPEDLRSGIEIPHEWIPSVLVVLFVLYAAQWPIRIAFQTRIREEELAQLEKTGTELSDKLLKLSNQTKVEIKINEDLKEIQKVLGRKNYWSEIFKEMSVLIPENVWLTRFSNSRKGPARPAASEAPKPEKKTAAKADPKSEKDPVAALLEQGVIPGAALAGRNPAGEGAQTGRTGGPEADLLLVQGEAISQMAVARFLTILEKSHYFSGARLVSTERMKGVKPAKFKFEFSIPIHAGTGGGKP